MFCVHAASVALLSRTLASILAQLERIGTAKESRCRLLLSDSYIYHLSRTIHISERVQLSDIGPSAGAVRKIEVVSPFAAATVRRVCEPAKTRL